MRMGIGIRIGRRRAGVSSGTVNTAVPTIDSTPFPGGAYTITTGAWTGSTSLALTLETSPTGGVPWTEIGAFPGSGTWANTLENLYVRAVVTALPGSVVARSASVQIGAIFDQVLTPAGGSNWLQNTVSTPPMGASLTASTSGAVKGLWVSAMWYFSGSGYKDFASIIGFSNGVNDSQYYMEIYPSAAYFKPNGGVGSYASATDPIAAGWYITTGRFYSIGGTDGAATVLFDEQTVAAADSAGGGVSLAGFTTWYEARGPVNDNNNFSDYPVAWIAAGRGDPAAAHAWVYNGGKKNRKMSDYDFAGDANAAIDMFRLYSRKSPGNTTFTTSQVPDSLGFLGTSTLNGSMAWEGRLPGWINPAGDPPATPAAFISPRFATTLYDANLTLNINTKNIGTALAGDLTITSLTHSVAGNIAGTVSGSTFPNPGVGTITGVVNGVTVDCEIIVPAAMPTNPQFWNRYNDNGLVAAIEEYPTYGAGTTYATIAAMKAGIDALGSGATLTIENLTEAGTLTLTAKDYGGATLRCRFRHGVAINNIVMDGVTGLTLRGFSCLNGGFDGDAMGGAVTLDHCTGTYWYLKGTTGVSEAFTVSNWIGPEGGVAGTCGVYLCNRYTTIRVAHGAINIAAADAHRVDSVNTFIQDRCWFGDVRGNDPQGHYDCQQSYQSGTQGFTQGIILNSVTTDQNLSGETPLSGCFFMTGINAQGFSLRRAVATPSTFQNIALGTGRQNCRIEDTTANGPTIMTAASLTFSSFVNNNVTTAAGNILPSAGVGVETNTYLNTVMATQYPDWNTYPDSWRRLRTPNAPFNSRGAFALIAELEAKRLTL